MFGNDPSSLAGLQRCPSRKARRAAKASVTTNQLGRHRVVLVAEVLERRTLLAAVPYQVTTLADDAAGATVGSLRYWLDAARTDTKADTITFAPGLTGTIDLVQVLDINQGSVNIVGPGPGLITLSGEGTHGIILVEQYGFLGTLSGLTLANGYVPDSGSNTSGSAIDTSLGFNNLAGTINLDDDVFNDNHANSINSSAIQLYGGGSIYSQANIENTLIENTSGPGSSWAFGTDVLTVNVDSVTVANNTVGGIDVQNGHLDATNSTFYNNSLQVSDGSAINTYNDPDTTITASTFVDNIDPGAVISDLNTSTTPALLTDDLFYGNQSSSPYDSLYGSFLSEGYNDFQTINDGQPDTFRSNLTNGVQTSDLLGVNPQLTALADFGGRTPTLAPGVGSGVVGKGDPGLESVDQRGVARSATAPTIGAFEGTGLVETVTTTASSGGGSLLTATNNANASGAGTTAITFDISNTGTPQSIVLPNGLPTINVPVVIDATSEPGFAGTPLVQLYGNNAFAYEGVTLGRAPAAARSAASRSAGSPATPSTTRVRPRRS